MTAMSDTPTYRLCLVHPDGMIRSIVASVVRELNLAHIDSFVSVDSALKQLGRTPLDGFMIWADDAPSVDFTARLRSGSLPWDRDLPLAILAPPSSAVRITQLLAHKPDRLLLTPFRIQTLIETLEHMLQTEKAPV